MRSSEKRFSALSIRFGDKASASTHLFVRPHRSEAPTDNHKEFLFVAGLPVLQQPLRPVLEKLFASFGQLSTVVVHSNQLTAVVAFRSEGAVEKVLRASAKAEVIEASLEESTAPHGLKRWMLEHKAKFPGNEVLKEQLNEWMGAFEKREEAAKDAAKKSDDGWTVVTRQPGRRKSTDPVSATAVGGISRAAAEARAEKKPVKQLENFYSHQKKEKQRAELHKLRERFQDDRKKVAEMRAARRFKPY